MPARDLAILTIILMSTVITTAASADVKQPSVVNQEVDTFGKLLAKQVELFESELEAKIQANQGGSKGRKENIGPVIASPMLEATQETNDKEPIVEIIWGMGGNWVAEVVYKGHRHAVSMQKPFISRLDGWKLDSISTYEIVLVKTLNAKEIARKAIPISWNQGVGQPDSGIRSNPSALFPHFPAVKN